MTIHNDGLRPDRAAAPAPHGFSPSAIMARARAHAFEQARRAAGKLLTIGDLTPAEILADMSRAIEVQASPIDLIGSDDKVALAPRSIGRRLALFGAAAALLAPPTARPAAARAGSDRQIGDLNADARLIAMGAELDCTLDGAAFAFDPVADEDDQDRRLERGNALQLDIAALPAVGLAGVLAKAKAYLDSNSYDTVNLAELADSLAEDAERVIGGLRA